MSVNISVNGKFRSCSKPSILDDPVRVKKQLECDLRKQRILEVREESKNLARKIRNDVAAEKERQLRNLEAIKSKELDCWRQHVLEQRNNDYREAIFQIGAAHHAAKLENEAMAERKVSQEQQRKQFQKKTNERLGVKPPQTTRKTLQTAGTQTPNVLMKGTAKKTPKKRKTRICPKEHTSTCHCSGTESEESSDEVDQRVNSEASRSPTSKSVSICLCPKVFKCPCTSASSSSSTLTSTLTDEEEHDKYPEITAKHPKLSKNPAVIVDVDVDSNDSVIITTPGEIRDTHAQSNRQFSHVVRGNSPEIRRRSSLKESTATMATATTSEAATKAPRPRFTQVSSLLNAKSATSGSQSRSPPRPPAPPPPTLAATSTTSTRKSPQKSGTSGNASRGVEITLSGATVTLDSGSKGVRDDNMSRVQSYDYNNKYTRDYPHPREGLVHEPSVRERSEPNAAERANMERELGARKEQERERIRERSEERGRKALEREQVRRDCLKLTEKLDALTEQYPQLLPQEDTRFHGHQLQANRAARTEQKRNSAIEELLLRPTIITCPEVDRQQTRVASPQRVTTTTFGVDDINLGAPRASDQINNTGSSESCSSILLGYVDDQQQKIRNDLHKYDGSQPKQDSQKAERLKNLLQRIEELRKALCEELGKSGNGDSMQQVINGVSDVRRERERIITHDAPDGDGRRSPMEKHIREMQQKEAVLEQKLRELCKMQKQQTGEASKAQTLDKKKSSNLKTTSDGKECRVLAAGNKPLEIIIKLKNDGSRRSKSKVKKSTKSPRKLSTLIDTPTRRLGAKRSTSSLRERQQQQQQKEPTAGKQAQMNRQNSYDSNSTSYRSLPSRIANEVDALVEHLELEQEMEEEEEDEDEVEEVEIEDHAAQEENGVTSTAAVATKSVARQTAATQRSARLNPLMAHYVQRLLGMSRNSIRALGVSSSDIETPSSSVMNISSNRTATTTVDMVNSQERVQRVQRFIEENRSFISELEDTLRSQSDVTIEESIRIFEEVWQQRLRKGMQNKNEKPLKEQHARQQRKEVQRVPERSAVVAGGARRRLTQERPADDRGRNEVPAMQRPKKIVQDARSTASTPAPQQQQQQRAEQRPQPATQNEQQKQRKQRQQMQEDANRIRTSTEPTQMSRESQPKRDISVATEERRAEAQIARYEQLTENCTQRIAELTELIQKVRTEKKRLMEVTLSSVSEGRNSTEYIELPDGTTRRRSNVSTDKNTSASSSGSSGASHRNLLTTQPTTSIDFTPQDTLDQQAAASSREVLSAQDSTAPLEKHKPTGISRDSGISVSRPLTAQEVEPPSQASTTTTTATTLPSTQGATRKHRPPPTMQRYSPNFVEDDVAHELSTILEVDTPITSRLNATTAGSATAAGVAAEVSRGRRLQPQPFPSFEEYAREMNLDITQLDANTSVRIHQEFETLISYLRVAQDGTVPDYREFPSLSAYLRNLSTHQEGVDHNQPPETIDDLIACLRIANLSIKSFPSRQEYLRQMAENSPSGELLDSASIDNITDTRTNTNTETESESLNIEDELRRRHILQHSFRTAPAKDQIFCSTARDGAEHMRGHSRVFTTESGIEQLTSTSANGSSEFERQLFSLGMMWPAAMRARTKKAEAVGSSNTSSSPERILQTAAGISGAVPTAQQRSSPRKVANDVARKSPQRSPDTTQHGTIPKRIQAVNFSVTKEVQFERSVKSRSPSQSPSRSADRQQSRSSPKHDSLAVNSQDAAVQQPSRKSPEREAPPIASATNEATRHSRSPNAMRARSQSRRSPRRSSDCEFLSDFGRPLNLRDFLTKELLKHASSSSSSTPTDDSLRSAFLQSIIDTMTPRTNGGSNQLDRQKTSTPVTHSAPSDARSSGDRDRDRDRSGSSSSNTPSQLFSGESCISSVRFFERSITRTYPRNAPPAAGKEDAITTTEQKTTSEK